QGPPHRLMMAPQEATGMTLSTSGTGLRWTIPAWPMWRGRLVRATFPPRTHSRARLERASKARRKAFSRDLLVTVLRPSSIRRAADPRICSIRRILGALVNPTPREPLRWIRRDSYTWQATPAPKVFQP